MVDVAHLRAVGEWGPCHEMGHNHQYKPFGVMDSTEVSCNFFSAFVQESVNGTPVIWTEDNGCAQDIREYLAAPGYASTLVGDVWMHLYFFLLLKQAFGWSVIYDTLSSYVDGSDTTDYSGYSSYERVDPLLLKLSVNSGRNLVPYARAWDYPLTDAGASAIEALTLPSWDFDSSIAEMDGALHPHSSTECYSPENEELTLVQYHDALLGNNTNMWHFSSYRGGLTVTENGHPCQRWDVQTPNAHSCGPESISCRGTEGGHNYCRCPGATQLTALAGSTATCPSVPR